MNIQTAWVKPPTQIGGLDHLAVQAPCINIYGRLLPGITNVTDRARYYSFYPWIVYALEQAGHRYDDVFIDHYRKADSLFTLIAERHAYTCGGDRDVHAAATTGSNNLAKQIADIKEGKPVRFSDFTHLEDGHNRYFKNKLGGLGQYYLGVLSELEIMDGTVSSGVKITNQIGKPIAEAMDKSIDRELFMETIKADLVSPDRLDQLHSFCPCQLLQNKEELGLLCDLLFVKGAFSDPDMLPRRRTLQTILHLSEELFKQDLSIDLDNFRGCVYSAALPDGSSLKLPEGLNNNRQRWAVYQRNELLSIAVQGLFYAILDCYDASGRSFDSVNELCAWFLSTDEMKELGDTFDLNAKVEYLVDHCHEWLPDLEKWMDENHEVQLARNIVQLCTSDKSVTNRTNIIVSALKILLALSHRPEVHQGYNDFIFPGHYFQYYPINLKSFIQHTDSTWRKLTLKDWVAWLTSHWGISAHLRVALRKLRGQSQSTFRVRPSDQGLEVITVPVAVFTSPRFNQALRILKDIGAIEKKTDNWNLSELGRRLKEI